jgi:hypothetical protein
VLEDYAAFSPVGVFDLYDAIIQKAGTANAAAIGEDDGNLHRPHAATDAADFNVTLRPSCFRITEVKAKPLPAGSATLDDSGE